MPKDYKLEIDNCDNWRDLKLLLDELALEAARALDAPYEDERFLRHTHDLELLLRYGERKLEKMLS